MLENSMPLVSVCIPAYNAALYVGEAIQSVLDQTYPNIEIIVVNDGSKDETATVLQPFETLGIKVLNQQNRGHCAAANAAFKQSTGDYIKFLDADDILSKNMIAEQVKQLKGRDNAVAFSAWGRFFKDDLSSFQLEENSIYRDMAPMDWLIAEFSEGKSMMQCGQWLIPRHVLAHSGLWDERLSLIDDFDFFIRVLLSCQEVLFTRDAILYYRSGLSNSLSGQTSGKAMESAYLSLQCGVDTVLRYENSGRTRKFCADAFQFWKYQFYPHHMALYKEAERRIKELGGATYPYPAGGATRMLTRILGWKSTKRLKLCLKMKTD